MNNKNDAIIVKIMHWCLWISFSDEESVNFASSISLMCSSIVVFSFTAFWSEFQL